MLDLTASPSHIISEINRLAAKVDGPGEASNPDTLSDEDAKAFKEILDRSGGSLTANDVKDAINKLTELHGKFLPKPGLPLDPGPPKLATAETPVMPGPQGAAVPPLEHKTTPDAAPADKPQPGSPGATGPQGAAVPPDGHQGTQSTPPPKPPILPPTPPNPATPNAPPRPPVPPMPTAPPAPPAPPKTPAQAPPK